VSKGQEDKVRRLKRSINDLKQSSKSWYFRFHKTILNLAYLWFKKTIMCISKDQYRGLCFLPCTLMTYCWLVKKHLFCVFEVKETGEARCAVGVEII